MTKFIYTVLLVGGVFSFATNGHFGMPKINCESGLARDKILKKFEQVIQQTEYWFKRNLHHRGQGIINQLNMAREAFANGDVIWTNQYGIYFQIDEIFDVEFKETEPTVMVDGSVSYPLPNISLMVKPVGRSEDPLYRVSLTWNPGELGLWKSKKTEVEEQAKALLTRLLVPSKYFNDSDRAQIRALLQALETENPIVVTRSAYPNHPPTDTPPSFIVNLQGSEKALFLQITNGESFKIGLHSDAIRVVGGF